MKNNITVDKFLVIGIAILLVLLIINLVSTIGFKNIVKDKIAEAKEIARPAQIELIKIQSNCEDCFSTDSIITVLKNEANITNEQILSLQEASELINKYNIQKLPSIILKGEISKVDFQKFTKNQDALILEATSPPYVDTKTHQVIGKVSAITITNNCDVCYDFKPFILNLKQAGVVFSDTTESNNSELITKYKIKKFPTLLLSKDIEAYPIAQYLKQAGIEVVEEYYFIEPLAPYVEVNTSNIRGMITLIMLNDSSCTECYDVTIHRQIIENMGMAIDKEEIININSAKGKSLLSKYNITKVPTMIIEGDVGVYENFIQVWPQVGIVEDGTYIFTSIDVLNLPYKDISTGKIIK